MNSLTSRRPILTAATLIVAGLSTAGLAGCGSSSKSDSSSTATPAAAAAASVSSTAGAGKPAITIGDKNFPEENILGTLYAQALKAKGYKVTLKDNIGDSEIIWKSFKAGQIDLYPEYTGTFLSTIAGVTAPPKNAADAYNQAKSYAQTQGATLFAATPFADSDALGAKAATASTNNWTTISDLAAKGKSIKLGGAPEFATREEGLVGLKKAYGINPTFKPIAIGLSYKALDSGSVDVQDVFTTDPQLVGGKYKLLTDPKGVFGFQNVAPVVTQKVATAEGPEFQTTIDAVSKTLTLPAVQALNKAVEIDKQPAATVAATFLKANNLL
jgi:osmoprotectant transport system substrate-binding protein